MTAAPQSTLLAVVEALETVGWIGGEAELNKINAALSLLRAALEAREEPAKISDERILHLWDTHVGEPSDKCPLIDADKKHFARAVLAASPVAAPVEARPVAVVAGPIGTPSYVINPALPTGTKLYASPVAADTQGDAREPTDEEWQQEPQAAMKLAAEAIGTLNVIEQKLRRGVNASVESYSLRNAIQGMFLLRASVDLARRGAVAADTQGDAQEGEAVAYRVRTLYAQGPGKWRYFDGDTHTLAGHDEELQFLTLAAMPPPPSSVSPLGPGEDEYLSWIKLLERRRIEGGMEAPADSCEMCGKPLPDGCSTEFQGDPHCPLTLGVDASREPQQENKQ